MSITQKTKILRNNLKKRGEKTGYKGGRVRHIQTVWNCGLLKSVCLFSQQIFVSEYLSPLPQRYSAPFF